MVKVSPNAADFRFTFRALVYREDRFWIAHCLETDVAAEGESPADAVHTLGELLTSLVEQAIKEGDLRSVFCPAPHDIWRLYGLGKESKIAARLSKRRSSINGIEVRELALA
jgi:predicted RNase H-like HicB family nuclease